MCHLWSQSKLPLNCPGRRHVAHTRHPPVAGDGLSLARFCGLFFFGATMRLIAGLLLFVASAVGAQTAPICSVSPTTVCAWNEDCLEWSRPTTRIDGSSLDATEIASYQLESAPVGATTWTQLANVNAPVQGYRRTGLKHGDAFQYRVWVTLKSGVKSVQASNVCNHVTTEPAPSPPVLKTADVVAFEIYKNSSGALAARAKGFVTLGMSCDGSKQQQVGKVTYTLITMVRENYVGQVDMATTAGKLRPTELYGICA